jgi:hypothetical protein
MVCLLFWDEMQIVVEYKISFFRITLGLSEAAVQSFARAYGV